jgi:predicted transcriptional regulator
MTYDRETRLMNSEVAYDILRELLLSDNEHGMYARELSESLDTSRNSIANYIKILREHNLIERTKRTQAQYYDINLDEIYGFMLSKWESIIDESNADLSNLFDFDEYCKKIVSNSENLNGSEFNQPIYLPKGMVVNYLDIYLEKGKTSTIEDMLIHDFILDLGVNVEDTEKGAELHVSYANKETLGSISTVTAIEELISNQWHKLNHHYSSVYSGKNWAIGPAANQYLEDKEHFSKTD